MKITAASILKLDRPSGQVICQRILVARAIYPLGRVIQLYSVMDSTKTLKNGTDMYRGTQDSFYNCERQVSKEALIVL